MCLRGVLVRLCVHMVCVCCVGVVCVFLVSVCACVCVCGVCFGVVLVMCELCV